MSRPWGIDGLLAGAMICLVFWGCGYRFAGSNPLPFGLTQIHIRLLENRSSETGAEVVLTNRLIEEFVRRRQVPVEEEAAAAAVLSGTLASLSTQATSRQARGGAAQRELGITLRMQLKNAQGQTLWQDSNISDSETYTVVSGDPSATEQNRRQALDTLAQRLAETVYQRMTEDF
jgi:hypothetical protein